jgi:hypothetical protein
MSRVRAVSRFNGRKNWANWNVDSSRASRVAFRSALAPPHYAGSAGDLVGAAIRSRGWGSVPRVPPPMSTR